VAVVEDVSVVEVVVDVVVVGNTVVLVVVESVVGDVVRSNMHPDKKTMINREISTNAFFISRHLQK